MLRHMLAQGGTSVAHGLGPLRLTGSSLETGRTWTDQRVLVVESNPGMPRYLLKHMSDLSCQAVVVRSLPDALHQLARASFDITVLDLEERPNLLAVGLGLQVRWGLCYE